MNKGLFISLIIGFILMSGTLTAFSQDKSGGLTLYTVRNEMGEDPQGTLEKVAKIGYKYIEATEYKDGAFYGMAPEAFKKQLDDLGLTPLSAHMGMMTLDNADQLIADVKAAGFQYFIAPVPPMGLFSYEPSTKTLSMSNDLDSLVNILSTIGKKCKEAGLSFLYHNHNFEFEENEDGIVPIDYMLEHLSPDEVNFQLDLYWVTKAEADPLAYFEQYPGRFKIWHVKDMDDQGRFAPVGKGNIDFGKILEKKEQAGMEYYIVEQDRTFDGMKPLEAIEISYEGLKEFGFN